MKQKIITLILMVGFLMNLTACKDVALVHDLNERDANEIIVLLARNNIPANKEKEVRNQEVFWYIEVSPNDEMQARSILVAHRLPRVRQGGLEGICKDAGLILTPKTERCRELLAYKGEIINSLESIPGVVHADVVLNIPEKDDFPDENVPQPRPTASVTVQYLKDANVQTRLTEAKVQEFVANTITDLDSRDVSVVISYLAQTLHSQIAIQQQQQGQNQTGQLPTSNLSTPVNDKTSDDPDNNENDDNLVSIGGIKMDASSAKKFKLISGLFLGVLLLLAFAFIFALIKMSRLRRQSSVPAVPDDSDDEQRLLEA
ncbi:MAG: hypothetical protein ABII18_10650 [bacterium]|nr:hypothetical protein [bacterium]MBU1917123.1 hypothetical protein [bacterium]